jgi:DNA-binding transcriptional LysR family regulator
MMPRLEINCSGEMEVFVRAVELASFSAAARAFEMSPSAVSKLVSRLEARLKVRLINRSTRQVQLTPEGCAFYERSVRVLADLHEAERCATMNERPCGKVSVNANVPFGAHFLLPLVPEFLERYPDITLDLELTDAVVDILEQRMDVAIRAGPLKSSSLLARKLGETTKVIVGAPSYLARWGTPLTPADLERHNLIGANYTRVVKGWPLLEQGQHISVQATGNVQASNGETIRHLALSGLGLARLALFQVKKDIAEERLLPVLEGFNPGDVEEVHAVFLGHGGHLPARVRALLDFLVEKVRFG